MSDPIERPSAGFGWVLVVCALGTGVLLYLAGDYDGLEALSAGLWIGLYVERSRLGLNGRR